MTIKNLDEVFSIRELICFKESSQSVVFIAEPSLDESGTCPLCGMETEKIWRFNQKDSNHTLKPLGKVTIQQILSLLEQYGKKTEIKTLELVYDGVVHYRRPSNHPDMKDWEEVVARNPLYTIREEEKQND